MTSECMRQETNSNSTSTHPQCIYGRYSFVHSKVTHFTVYGKTGWQTSQAPFAPRRRKRCSVVYSNSRRQNHACMHYASSSHTRPCPEPEQLNFSHHQIVPRAQSSTYFLEPPASPEAGLLPPCQHLESFSSGPISQPQRSGLVSGRSRPLSAQ
jgi:hypothetical protein